MITSNASSTSNPSHTAADGGSGPRPEAVLRCVRPGRGTALVLAHAYPLDSRMWGPVIDALPDEQCVFTLEIPGVSVSDEPSLDGLATRIADGVRAMGMDRAVYVGLSMGGYLLLALLAQAPDLISGLGLFDTRAGADTPEARENRLRVAQQVQDAGSVEDVLIRAGTLVGETTRQERPEVIERIREWIGEKEPGQVAWAQRAMAARPDRAEALRAYDGPVTVLVGEEDELTPPDVAAQMRDQARNATFVVVPRAGHLSAIETPEAVATAIQALIARAG